MSFKPYGTYQESNVEWLGQVPSHWSMRRLKQVADVRLSNIDKHSVEGERSVLLCNYLDVYRNRRIDNRIEFMRATASEEQIARLSLTVGDCIITKDSEDSADIGVPAILSEDVPGLVCGYHLALLRPYHSELDGLFLRYLCESAVTKAHFDVASRGLTRYALGLQAISNLRFALPPLPEQLAIAAFLDRETAKIETLVDAQRRLLDLLTEEIASLALPHLRCGPTVRLSAIADVILRPVILRADESYTPLGLFNRGRGLFHKEPHPGDEMGDSEFFWVKADDLIISGQFAWEGAVALASGAESGCVVSHRYHILRSKDGRAITEYLFAFLCSTHGRFLLSENSRGAAGRNRPLNIRTLMKEEIPLANISVQRKVADAVRVRRLLAIQISQQIALLRARQAALISAAVTGKIDVRGLVKDSPTVPEVAAA